MATATPPLPDAALTPLEPDGLYEVIDGEIVEIPYMGAREGFIAARLVKHLNRSEVTDRLGHVVFEVLFLIDHDRNLRRRPDVAFVSYERWPIGREIPDEDVAWEVVPDLAVEVVSPSNFANEVVDKVADYFQAGTRLVWCIYPNQKLVYVYESPIRVRIIPIGEGLDGGDVLPGFKMPVQALFGGGAAPA